MSSSIKKRLSLFEKIHPKEFLIYFLRNNKKDSNDSRQHLKVFLQKWNFITKYIF